MNYLFRYPHESHIFITTEDPSYRYEVLCGHCDYPIDWSDEVCPRCQRELEECPICSRDRHVKPPKVKPDSHTAGKTCPVCKITRIPFGERRVSEIRGTFCTNLYGCPAGGFLLKSEEFAVLPMGATICPICNNEELTPADVKTFTHLLNLCWFCNTTFGSPDHWKKDWAGLWNENLEKVRPASRKESDSPCRLCGRNDQRVDPEKTKNKEPQDEAATHEDGSGRLRLQSFVLDPEGQRYTNILDETLYLRVAELGRILVLELDDESAFSRAFEAWFLPVSRHEGEVRVGDVAKELLAGTLCSAQYRILQKRLSHFTKAWERKLPSGLEHRIPESEGRKPPTHC